MPSWTWLVTIILLLTGTIIWVGWDIVVATNNIQGDTISEIILYYTRRYPTIIFSARIFNGPSNMAATCQRR